MAGAILYPTTKTLSIPAMRLLPFLTVRVFAGVALLIETNSSTGSVDPDYKTVRVPFLHTHFLLRMPPFCFVRQMPTKRLGPGR